MATESNNIMVKECRFKLGLAVSVLAGLSKLLPIQKTVNPPSTVFALARFTSEKDAWTTRESFARATAVLEKYSEEARIEDIRSFWSVVENILKERIRPLFAEARNPAITVTGRKDFHPIPLPRFDSSILDPTSKPWKVREVSSTTVFSWIVSQYLVRLDPSHIHIITEIADMRGSQQTGNI